ncbi:hypothetical protein MMC22_000435 [Lobaria immixta]|nr:hypothetical protein [Lobaria immixta]
MDTAAYLTRQGWLGSGHSLHPTGHGIAKPLLISKKLDLLGLGQRKNDVHADQWWARDFDTTLMHLNVGTYGATEKPEKVASKTELHPLHDGWKRGRGGLGNGLYGNFVKGEGLIGTHTPEGVEQVQTGSSQNSQAMENEDEAPSYPKRRKHKKRKRESLSEKVSFSRHSHSLTPEIDVCGNDAFENSPRMVKRGYDMGGREESQTKTKSAFANTKKGPRGAEAARKQASKDTISRKERHRGRRQRDSEKYHGTSSGFD